MDLMKIKDMEYDELRNLIEAASAEMAARRRRMQEKSWEAVRQAIREYTREFGEIKLDYGEYSIPDACNFATVGTIFTYEVEKGEEDW